MNQFLLFKPKGISNKIVEVGEDTDGTYFLPAAQEVLGEFNRFVSLSEIEELLGVELEHIRSKDE